MELNSLFRLIAYDVVIWGCVFRMRLKRMACCMGKRFISLVALSVSGLQTLFISRHLEVG